MKIAEGHIAKAVEGALTTGKKFKFKTDKVIYTATTNNKWSACCVDAKMEKSLMAPLVAFIPISILHTIMRLMPSIVLIPIIPFIPLIAAGIGAAVSGVELANQPKAPTAPTQVGQETQQAQAQQAAALAQAQALQKRRGLSATILTSPTGVSGGPAQTQTATLGT